MGSWEIVSAPLPIYSQTLEEIKEKVKVSFVAENAKHVVDLAQALRNQPEGYNNTPYIFHTLKVPDIVDHIKSKFDIPLEFGTVVRKGDLRGLAHIDEAHMGFEDFPIGVTLELYIDHGPDGEVRSRDVLRVFHSPITNTIYILSSDEESIITSYYLGDDLDSLTYPELKEHGLAVQNMIADNLRYMHREEVSEGDDLIRSDY